MADDAFTDCSQAVPLDEIARRAGLGRATVYRHFPDRHALAVAVVGENLRALEQAAEAADADAANGEHRSFRDLLYWVFSTQLAMRPLAALIRELPARAQQEHIDALIAVLTPPFRRAQAEGRLRPDLEPPDLALFMTMLDAAAEAVPAGTDRAAAARRLITVVFDGILT
ncbi:TetR/AcrR family transcriptional regulator [Frankia sp. Mgl5]|uniref:TetR/AcrR family transcriptional regulator n=1 Tax=Frankia sp. Mgl5 TaxID=2933793 RepID=UPI00200C7E99|nr:TetR/AcrR family transcriptional regulator [Frankia sp. Mgl5]MCK9929233.1 TetR/AcrR family transcriptional regulator [Frankia sp. Mgl5]